MGSTDQKKEPVTKRIRKALFACPTQATMIRFLNEREPKGKEVSPTNEERNSGKIVLDLSGVKSIHVLRLRELKE